MEKKILRIKKFVYELFTKKKLDCFIYNAF